MCSHSDASVASRSARDGISPSTYDASTRSCVGPCVTRQAEQSASGSKRRKGEGTGGAATYVLGLAQEALCAHARNHRLVVLAVGVFGGCYTTHPRSFSIPERVRAPWLAGVTFDQGVGEVEHVLRDVDGQVILDRPFVDVVCSPTPSSQPTRLQRIRRTPAKAQGSRMGLPDRGAGSGAKVEHRGRVVPRQAIVQFLERSKDVRRHQSRARWPDPPTAVPARSRPPAPNPAHLFPVFKFTWRTRLTLP